MASIRVERGLRPCLLNGGAPALFHMWEERSKIIEPSPMVGGHAGGVLRYTLGIVETLDGQIREVEPHKIQFTDEKVKEYCFRPEDSSPIGKTELFGKIDGNSIYVVRDEYGRIVISDELMRELIERATGSSEEVQSETNKETHQST